MVVACQNHIELPDNAQAMSDEEVKKLPSVSGPQMDKLLQMLLDAQQR